MVGVIGFAHKPNSPSNAPRGEVGPDVMRADALGTFAAYLAQKFTIAGDLLAKTRPSDRQQGDIPLRNLWEASELPANEFADEVAEFYGLARLSLPELSTATALVSRFSHRFLRESVVFPYQAPDLSFRLAAADPTDEAAIRAA